MKRLFLVRERPHYYIQERYNKENITKILWKFTIIWKLAY